MIDETAAVALLEPLAATLRADGYDLAVRLAGSSLAVDVIATPSACVECLVPKTLMAEIINDAIAKGDPQAQLRVDLTYPADLPAH